MKFLPVTAALACVILLVSCGRQADNAEAEKQDQQRLDEENQAAQERALHEQEAALDERERLLDERQQQLDLAPATPSPAQPQQSPPPPAAAPPPTAATTTDASSQLFYDYLAPYGSWIEMVGYGYVWQPLATVEDSTWRPYTLGHWAFTDNGWTWMSDEPFGWITYHYGRWMRTHTLNWVWVPADQWAPAWVSWRYGNDFVGWAPLPPEARFDGPAGIQQWADQQYDLGASDYTFVPAAEFGDQSMAAVQVPPDDVGPIYDESNNVTDMVWDPGSYAIICYGLSYDFVRSKCRIPLPPPLKVERAGVRADGKNGAVVSGNTLHITAPRIGESRTPAAPKYIRERAVDARLIAVARPQPAPGDDIQPLYRPPQPASTPIERLPQVAVQQPAAPAPNNPDQPAPANTPLPPRENSAPPAPDTDAQRAHDLEIIQRQQAAREAGQQQAEQQRAEEEARAARDAEQQQIQQQRAEDEARSAREAERAAAEEQAASAARAARDQEQAAREEAVRQAQPAGSPAAGLGRGQP